MLTEDFGYDETLGANTPEQLENLRKEYRKKFSVEYVHDTDSNLETENLKNLVAVLGQLTIVDIDDTTNLRNHIQNMKVQTVNKSHILVVKYEDKIIGTGTLLIEHKIIHSLGKVGHIEDIVIDNEYRGLGLAKMLIDKLISIGTSENCYKIILDASDDVAGFYEKLGFHKHSNNMRCDL